MTDREIRVLGQDELRAANDLFRATLHAPPSTDEQWTVGQHTHQPGRALGAFEPELVGMTRSMDTTMTVPGGATLPTAAVTGVGVRSDRTRRGVLRDLMRTQLTDLADRGTALAVLHATEGVIYGRFGYGMASYGREIRLDRRQVLVHPQAPAGGEVRMLGYPEAATELREIHAALPRHRPGLLARSGHLWSILDAAVQRDDLPFTVAVHHGADGPDGYAIYQVRRGASPRDPNTLSVMDMHTGTDEAFAGLWRYLLRIDLVTEIRAYRPVDEPVELLLTEPRACTVPDTYDESWLRLVAVEEALAARSYGPGDAAVVLEVSDPVLERNSGRYLVSAAGATRTGEPAQARLGVDTLAMLYLGAWRASALTAVGRIEVTASGVPAIMDSLFGTRTAPWCGTFF